MSSAFSVSAIARWSRALKVGSTLSLVLDPAARPEEQLLVVFETESYQYDGLPDVDCSSGEVSGVRVSQLALTMPTDDEVDGTLTVAIVVCQGSEDGSCSWDESGDVVDYEVRAELSKDLRVP